MYILPNNRQRCPFSVSLELSCYPSAGNPCGHVGWQNCHSAQHSERCILSPYRGVTFWFGYAVTSRITVNWGGHIWGPYVVRQLSCDMCIVICKVAVRGVSLCSGASKCCTGHTPSCSVCLCRVVLPVWVSGRVWPCTTEISSRQTAVCRRCFPKWLSTRHVDIWQGFESMENFVQKVTERIVCSVGPPSGAESAPSCHYGEPKSVRDRTNIKYLYEIW